MLLMPPQRPITELQSINEKGCCVARHSFSHPT
uniref:Uncharacterized protein n=1 Tax=Rhizophora mucronata TaxID=61149 RepID=A0A2P2QQC7_RHIMU